MLEVQVLAMWMGERGAVWRGTRDPGLPGGGTTEVRELQEEKEPRWHMRDLRNTQKNQH